MATTPDIAIIGAGPCGLMAAERLAQAGCTVTVYDRMPSPARKFLMAGRGGLNLTHSEALEDFLTRYGEAAPWLEPSIRAFPPSALRAWCEGLGQETFIGTSGRVFPRSMKAVQLLRAWLRRLEEYGVRYLPRHTWHGWKDGALQFSDGLGAELLARPDATLLALGGASWPRLGSDGGWMAILAAAGVAVRELQPSNCGFIVPWSAYFGGKFAGTPLKTVAVTHAGITRHGEAMLTQNGIEGGVIYALSAGIRDAVIRDAAAVIQVDLRPSMPQEALAEKLRMPRANKSLATYLRRLGFAPVVPALLREVLPQEQLTALSPDALAELLKALPLTLRATTGLTRAISSAGGICREAVNADFMLHARPSVFAAGEMLDWEAPTGGYLLQGCYSTAVAAAGGILRYCDAEPHNPLTPAAA